MSLWVPAGHYYSPLVDPGDDLVQKALENEASPADELSSFGIDEATLWTWFERIGIEYDRHRFPEQYAPGGSRYHYGNPNFPLADALALTAFMRQLRPKRLIEVGSGYSSCVALDVGGPAEFTFIEPYLDNLPQGLASDPTFHSRLMRKRLQDVPLDVFTALEAGDILFIDSSHVAKTGSDVVDYLFRVLPALQPGVAVHIHDIFYPFEYSKAWIVDENRSWNEAYLLRAFLHGNPSWQVLFFFDWFYKCRRAELAARMPDCIAHRGGSIWLMKTTPPSELSTAEQTQ